MQMNLKHLDVVQESAAEVLAAGDKAVVRFTAIWQSARGPEDQLGILAARSQLLDYLAAGHVLRDNQTYSAACAALLDHASVFVERFQPVSEILLVELSLALTAKRRPLARALAKVILSRGRKGVDTLESYQAWSLAALLDLDYPLVEAISMALTDACENKVFDKLTCGQGLLWAVAVHHLAGGDSAGAERAIQELQQLHISTTDRELGKLKRGGASAFAPFDMIDLPVAALLSLTEAVGYTPQPLSEAAYVCGYGLGLKSNREEG